MAVTEVVAPEQIAAQPGCAPAAQRRGRWRLRLALLALVVVFLMTDLGVAGALIVNSTLPQTRGTVHLTGPHGAITITRDHFDVPHVQADDTHDLFFAQGYVTAQDRLWQMEFDRRLAAGTLSAIFGAGTVSADEFLHTTGLALAAQSDVDHLSPDLRAEFDAYTRGVNTFIDTHHTSLPLEFRVLGFTPAPWRDTDSVTYGKIVALALDNTWNTKLARMNVLAAAGPAAAADLFPTYPGDNPTLTDGSGVHEIAPNKSESAAEPSASAADASLTATLTPLQVTTLRHLPHTVGDVPGWLRQVVLGNVASSEGSNDWVVSGAHTTTGKPLLANDPHLGINYPSVWYEIALSGGGLDEMGFTFPGLVGIVIGHNAHIAWGMTNGQVDNTDLFIEKLSADGSSYLHDGQMLPLETRKETINVAGGKDVTITIRVTDHGPIINSVVDLLKHVATPIALEWTAIQHNYTIAGFLNLGAAQNWEQFQDALKAISMSQNFVYADTAGNIGYRLSGWVPLRPAGNGLLPVDGTTSADDWHGYVPFDQMPHLFNPPAGIILTANNRVVAPNYPYYVTNDWDVGFRARRIEQLLTAKPQLSVADFAAIQNDVVSLPATQITPFLLAVAAGPGTGAARGQQLLRQWDGAMTRDSAAAAFYEVTTSKLIQNLTKPVLGADYSNWDDNEYATSKVLFLRNQLMTPQAPFLSSTDARDAAIVQAEHDAFAYLQHIFGTDDTSKWQWGVLHQAHFDHPLTGVPILRLVFPHQMVTRPGDMTTINTGGDDGFTNNHYEQKSLASLRQIIDLSNLDNSRFIITTGESGQSFSPHNFDLLPLWDSGRYQSMDFSAAAIKADAAAVLILEP